MLQEGLKECFNAELHSDIKVITNDGGVATIHQLVLAASSPLLRKAILNIDPAGRAMDEALTVLLPDFSTADLNTLLPWLYGDGSDEQQPDPELVKVRALHYKRSVISDKKIVQRVAISQKMHFWSFLVTFGQF